MFFLVQNTHNDKEQKRGDIMGRIVFFLWFMAYAYNTQEYKNIQNSNPSISWR